MATQKETLQNVVNKQVLKVLERGQRFSSFDQVRQRHFWSNYLFAYGAGNAIAAGPYDIFRLTASMQGQGYPVPLTARETDWRGVGRVPDNQNFVISEIGVSVIRPPAESSVDADHPANGIFENLPAGIQALINPRRAVAPQDAAGVLYGMNLEMSYLTNNVPLGYCADFSQSAGIYAQQEEVQEDIAGAADGPFIGDPSNGVPAAAFRRKLEVPILLQHGEAMGMRLVAHRPISTLTLDQGGAGWLEVRVDWWATESFVERS